MERHRHQWSVVDFRLEDDRPIMRQACVCGATRSVPAWDRSWTPDPAPPAGRGIRIGQAPWRLTANDHGAIKGRLMEATGMLPSTKGSDSMIDTIKIDIWSDVACPWCYIGKRNLEAGIGAYQSSPGRPPVEIEYHSFELAPDTPVDFDGSEADYLMRIKGIGQEQAVEMLDRVAGIAAGVGLRYDFGAVQHTRTVKAHQLLHYAKARGLQGEAKERVLSAYFVEGRHVGRDEDLADLAAEIGLDRSDVLRSLREEEFLADVRADQRQAMAYGIRGVPFFVLDGKYGLSGAQPPETFAEALAQVADERGVGAGSA